MPIAWMLLAVAIASEIAATLSLKPAGDGSLPALGVVVVGYVLSLVLLGVVVRSIDVGIAYAVWAGLGTAVVAGMGIALFGEPVNAAKVASLALVVVGVVGLNLAGAH